jgi:hypothetical protein
MKYLIAESRLNDFIYDYLSKNYHPDYNWGPELHDFYLKDIQRYGYISFLINDSDAYGYVGMGKNQLLIKPWIVEKLDNMFGYSWKDIFVKWFEHNSGLSVKEVIDWEQI